MTPLDRLANSLVRTVSSDRVSIKADIAASLIAVARAAQTGALGWNPEFCSLDEQQQYGQAHTNLGAALVALDSAIAKALGEGK